MFKLRCSCLFAAGVFVLQSVATAVPPTTAPVAPSAGPAAVATGAVTAATPLPADNLDTLRAHVGETVDVKGVPTTTGHSKQNTVAYLNFGPAHKAVALVAFQSEKDGGAGNMEAKKIVTEETLKGYVGKAIIVHGKLADYKGDLQIVLDSTDQIKVVP